MRRARLQTYQRTALSRTLSKDLIKRGFRFVGPKFVMRSCNQLTRVSSTKTLKLS